MSNKITCPNCKSEFEVSEALSSQLEEQMKAKLSEERKRLDEEYENKLKDLFEKQEKEKERFRLEAVEKAKELVAVELKDKEDELESTKSKLKETQDKELEFRKKSRELEEEKKEFELTLNRTLDEERQKIRDAALKEASEDNLLKDAEKEKLINDLKKQIGELKRKSEQGSQQLQGEILEIQLEDLLARTFSQDEIEEVPKGMRGADVIQKVYDSSRNFCGSILWESKRKKNWSDQWFPKLRDDQRESKSEIAVLVSQELPETVSTFTSIDGVWVTSWPCTTGLAAALRTSLIQVAHAKLALDGQQGKMEIIYNYLSGSEFRHRVEGIVEAFVSMKEDLDSEKRSMQRIWSKREKQLERAISQTAGLHGDLTGIIGGNIPLIEQLSLNMIESKNKK